ncbi:hypothetical protein pb186bvf_002082 [Paramecium bursaria]
MNYTHGNNEYYLKKKNTLTDLANCSSNYEIEKLERQYFCFKNQITFLEQYLKQLKIEVRYDRSFQSDFSNMNLQFQNASPLYSNYNIN